MDLKARLDEIDSLAGRVPGPDPARIYNDSGMEVGPPPIRQREEATIPEPDWLNGEEEVQAPSPLAPRFAPQAPSMPTPDLAVIVVGGQRGATLKGRDVALTEAEVARVTKVIIGALRRSLREQEREIVGLLPKRAPRSDSGKKRKK